jgi:hypothetical protein
VGTDVANKIPPQLEKTSCALVRLSQRFTCFVPRSVGFYRCFQSLEGLRLTFRSVSWPHNVLIFDIFPDNVSPFVYHSVSD